MKKGISLLTSVLLTVSAMPVTTSAQTQLDLNGDGLVNGYDANLIMERYMEIAVQEYNSPVLTDEIRAQIEAVADLNGDGDINAADPTILLKEIKRNNKAGDINCDGILDGRDASAILSYYAKRAVGYAYSAEEKGLEYCVYALGDYDGNDLIDGRDASEVLKTYMKASTDKT